MNPKTTSLLLFLALAFFLIGCASAKMESYVSPGYQSQEIKSVALLPISNARISAGNSAELLSSFTKAVSRKSPNLRIISGYPVIKKLNTSGMAGDWADFLRDYSYGGIQNINTIRGVSNVLEVDSIIQGTIIDIKQEDSNGYNYPITRVSIRYTMFSGSDGSILWEVTGEGSIQPYSYKAAPIYQAVKIANEKILSGLPL